MVNHPKREHRSPRIAIDQSSYRGQQVADAYRLGNIVVGSGLKALSAVIIHGMGRLGNDGNMMTRLSYFSYYIQSADVRQTNIHQDKIRLLHFLKKLQCVTSRL